MFGRTCGSQTSNQKNAGPVKICTYHVFRNNSIERRQESEPLASCAILTLRCTADGGILGLLFSNTCLVEAHVYCNNFSENLL
jgi:hypothetical protein